MNYHKDINILESKADSGAAQCDVDSGSDCNDIYERRTMAALESFGSEEDMRDSAVYSDGEDSVLTTPVFHRSFRPVSLSPTKELHKQRAGVDMQHERMSSYFPPAGK